MLQLSVTYLHLLGMRDGQIKWNKNQSYCVFTHMNFTMKGENFKLQRTHK